MCCLVTSVAMKKSASLTSTPMQCQSRVLQEPIPSEIKPFSLTWTRERALLIQQLTQQCSEHSFRGPWPRVPKRAASLETPFHESLFFPEITYKAPASLMALNTHSPNHKPHRLNFSPLPEPPWQY